VFSTCVVIFIEHMHSRASSLPCGFVLCAIQVHVCVLFEICSHCSYLLRAFMACACRYSLCSFPHRESTYQRRSCPLVAQVHVNTMISCTKAKVALTLHRCMVCTCSVFGTLMGFGLSVTVFLSCWISIDMCRSGLLHFSSLAFTPGSRFIGVLSPEWDHLVCFRHASYFSLSICILAHLLCHTPTALFRAALWCCSFHDLAFRMRMLT